MRIRTLLGATALALLLASTAWTEGGVPVGDEAPDFDGGDVINSEPVKIGDLKGRLILLELFSTT